MTALEIVLIVAVAVLAVALAITLRTRVRDRTPIEARPGPLDELAEVRAAREHAEAELHEARLRIVALEHRRNRLEADAEEAGRLGLFRRSSSGIPPEDTEREQTRTSRGGA